jgi:cadmium resistance protein CadD (predicted permease)
VVAQAAGFALLAAVSPTALLVMAVFLASANPRATALMYTAGAFLMTVAMAVVVLFVLRAANLNQGREQVARYGLRLGLGLVALLLCAFLAARSRRGVTPATLDKPERAPGLIDRMTANPSPRTAFIVGLVLFAPGATFIAAVQVIATSNASPGLQVAAMVIVIALASLTVWLPLLCYLAAPEATTRWLRNANGWLRANGRTMTEAALAVGGIALTIDGALGLWG